MMNTMVKGIIFFSFLSLMIHLAQAQQPTPQSEKLFAAGVQALKAGQLDEAEKTFLQLLRQGGKASFVHHNLGIVYQQQNAHEKALWQFREAIRLQPDFGEARLLIGYSLLSLGKTAEAGRELERAVKLLPDQPQARLQLAKVYERSGNWFGVIDQYRTLRVMEPRNGEYAYQLGKAYNRLSDWSYQKIIRVNPASARLYQTLGQNYLQQGKYELAIMEYQRAIQADPKLPELHLALALIHLEQKRFDEAAKEIELELNLAPESAKALGVKRQIQAATR
jgi:Tfp pilus assembly protein PilF